MKRKWDIVVVCQLFYPELVSTGQTLTELLEELSSKGLRIKVIASQPTILAESKRVHKEIEYKGIFIKRTWSTRFPKISFLGKTINLLTFFISASFEILVREHRSPLLLLTNPPYLPLLGWLSYFIYRLPFGVLLFDIMPEQAVLLRLIKYKGVIAWLWKSCNYIWYKYANYVIVLSKDMLEGALDNARLRNHNLESVCRDKTHIIHVWSDDRVIKPTPKNDSPETNRLNVSDKFVIQYSGNHGRFHDIETLLGIIDTLSTEKDILFQFIGEGFKKKLVDEFKNFRKLENVFLSGYAEKELLSDSLAMADLSVVAQLPGQERVCYPSKLLGIMASGRAVFAICPKDTEMSKMIIDNNLGFVIANNDIQAGVDTVLYAKSHKDILKNMGINCYNYLIEHFTLDKAANKYFELIKKQNQ